IGKGDFIHTQSTFTKDPVNIVIGAVPVAPVLGTKPANVVIGPGATGTAFYGQNGINVPTPVVTLNLLNSNIVFNTGSLSASA
ncbi:hypothetical protein ABTE71_20220, partial [Acinetobacter baumannii]